jgi:phospholipid-binding lipoprotein MlaA
MLPSRPLRRTLSVVAIACALSACAAKPPSTDEAALADYRQNNDPIEPTNRFFYKINDGIDTYVLRPVAVAYRQVPGAIRRPVHNVVTNLAAPVTLVNDVLQTKPRRAGDTLMRFAINSTVGGLGLFDVATDWGYPAHTSDFGVTMALWGVGEGPYLFLPVLGPSGARDSAGYVADIGFDPLTYASFGGSRAVQLSRYGLTALDTRERLIDPIDQVKKSALDPYATFRSLYRQNRQDTIDRTRDDNRATVPAWFSR